MRIVVLVALLLAPALVHAAPPAFVGKWKVTAVRTKAGPVPKAKLAGGGITWDFKADGALTITVWQGKQVASSQGTWTVDGNTITVDESGKVETMTFKKKGAKLELAGIPPKSTVVMTLAKTK